MYQNINYFYIFDIMWFNTQFSIEKSKTYRNYAIVLLKYKQSYKEKLLRVKNKSKDYRNKIVKELEI